MTPSTRFFCLLALLPALVRADVASIREELAREKLRRVDAYLLEHPAPPDELAALNLALEAHQELKHVLEMIPLLRRRYDLMVKDPQTQLPNLLERTAIPLAQALASQHQRPQAVEFLNKVKQDFKPHPAAAQIHAALDQVIRAVRPPEVGDKPEFTVHDLTTGKPVQSADFKGSYTQLEFWVSTCEICQAQKDLLQVAVNKFGPRGFKVLGFNRNEKIEDAQAFLAKEKLPWPNAWDLDPRHQFAQKLNIDYIPTGLLLDPEGKIIALNLRGEALLKKLEELYPAK